MKKINVLIIFADQQRFDTVHAAGFEHMITPNLDKLASEGCLYTHAHSHNPVCMPARHDLLTGLTARHHGYFGNAGTSPIKDYSLPTVARIFSEANYRTASIGKMHFYPTRAHHGYNEMYVMEEIPKCKQDDDFATYLSENGDENVHSIHGVRPIAYHTPQTSLVKEENYETKWVEKTTKNWLDKNGDNPFFLFVGFIKPHPPWDIPESYQGMYKDVEFPETIVRSREYPETQNDNPLYGDLDSKEQIRKNKEAYYTACSMVDESAGEIIEHLRAMGKLDDTMVIYTSDHGEMLADKGYYSKDLPYEGASRVPFIVRFPERVEAGTKKDEFVDLLDIFPTCLDIAGLKYPECDTKLYGSSIFTDERDRSIVYASNGFLTGSRWLMARTHEYKYIYKYNQGTEELYDLVNDPQEIHNIVSTMKDSDIYKYLKEKAIAYESKEGPEGAVVDNDFIVIDAKPHVGHEHGKYHLWSNMQFQTFLNLGRKEFGENFVEEFKKALSNKEHSGCEYNEIFNDPLWKETFEENFVKHGDFDNIVKELFK